MKFFAIMSKRTKANTGKYPKRQDKDTMDQGAEKMENTKTSKIRKSDGLFTQVGNWTKDGQRRKCIRE